MIDSNYTITLSDAILQFREYITQNHGSDSAIAQAYIRIADDLERYASEKNLCTFAEKAIQEYYGLAVGVPPFEAPPLKSKERPARAIRMIHDILHHKEPKRRYISNPLDCPISYQVILGRYESLMEADQKSYGTIRTRSGRMKVFFIYLTEIKCTVLQSVTPVLFADFVSSLNDRYSSQGKASILYTIRNFFSYDEFSEMLTFDPVPFLSGIHSKKHERLSSFYTAEEVKRILNAVDRSTPWGKQSTL